MEVKGEEIVNRVTSSSLVTFDLEKFYVQGDRVGFDIASQLYQGLILREKEFREFVKANDWSVYKDKLIAINCSADAIVPTWAYMLLGIALGPYARHIVFGTPEELEIDLFRTQLRSVNWSDYQDAKVVVKGCSKVDVPTTLYVEVTNKLLPFASSIMFGEPCSTVPLYKKPRAAKNLSA
jgi:hypothetical protein